MLPSQLLFFGTMDRKYLTISKQFNNTRSAPNSSFASYIGRYQGFKNPLNIGTRRFGTSGTNAKSKHCCFIDRSIGFGTRRTSSATRNIGFDDRRRWPWRGSFLWKIYECDWIWMIQLLVMPVPCLQNIVPARKRVKILWKPVPKPWKQQKSLPDDKSRRHKSYCG